MNANPMHMRDFGDSSPRSSRGAGAAGANLSVFPSDSSPSAGHRATFFPPVAGADSTKPGSSILTLEPPKNLSGKVIFQRLEGQAAAFRKGTFAEHVKEYDMLTGERKMRIDEGRLHKAE